MLPVRQRALEKEPKVYFGETRQAEDPTAGEQGADHFEGRVFGGGSHEGDRPRFHVGEEGILLGAIQAMDLIEEEQAGPALLTGLPRRRHRRAHFLHSGLDPGKSRELRVDMLRQELREGGLADSGGSPEDAGGQGAGPQESAEGPFRAEEGVLPHDVLDSPRSHALRQRARRTGRSLAGRTRTGGLVREKIEGVAG